MQNFLWKVGTPEYDAALDEAAGMIARAERVFLVGIGNSGSIAEIMVHGIRPIRANLALGVTDHVLIHHRPRTTALHHSRSRHSFGIVRRNEAGAASGGPACCKEKRRTDLPCTFVPNCGVLRGRLSDITLPY
ncbi:MAG: hypothetical protein ACLTVY_00105 [Faecalibacterium sp.]